MLRGKWDGDERKENETYSNWNKRTTVNIKIGREKVQQVSSC